MTFKREDNSYHVGFSYRVYDADQLHSDMCNLVALGFTPDKSNDQTIKEHGRIRGLYLHIEPIGTVTLYLNNTYSYPVRDLAFVINELPKYINHWKQNHAWKVA